MAFIKKAYSPKGKMEALPGYKYADLYYSSEIRWLYIYTHTLNKNYRNYVYIPNSFL